MKKMLIVNCLIVSLFLISCVGPYQATRVDNPLEQTEKIVLMDNKLQDDVTITGLRKGRLENGLLKVEAQIKNQTDEALPLQIKLKFKDKDNFFVEETNWIPVVVPHYEIYTFESNSLSDKPDDYVICIRYAK